MQNDTLVAIGKPMPAPITHADVIKNLRVMLEFEECGCINSSNIPPDISRLDPAILRARAEEIRFALTCLDEELARMEKSS